MADNSENNLLDPQNMLSQIDSLPDQLVEAWQLGFNLPLHDIGKVNRVVIAGMGGSAIGGDLLASYMADQCPVPVVVHRGYDLPAWAYGKDALVICSSHSGNTEETLSAFDAAVQGDCTIFTLSTGGKLAEKATSAGAQTWIFNHQGQPRTAVGYSFGILLALFSRLGLVDVTDAVVADTVAAMKNQQRHLTAGAGLATNPARRLAGQLVGRYVSVFAAGSNEVIARRWKTQINELAKAWAEFEGLPEADHNTLAGLINPETELSKVAAIFLSAPGDHPRNKIRLAFTRQQMMLAGLLVDDVMAKGESPLAQMWTLLHFGDYVAYYLALMYGVDPTPIEALIELKNYLVQH